MTAEELKTEALCWLRFVKKMDYVCTEIGKWSADVQGVNDKICIEIETKISKSDLRAEFLNKKAKHFSYGSGLHGCPNYYYLMVPSHLSDFCQEIATKNNERYGVLALEPQVNGVAGRKLAVIKKARRLHDHCVADKLRRTMLMRMSSELCCLHLAQDRLCNWVSTEIQGLRGSIAESINNTLANSECHNFDSEITHEENQSPKTL